jgi:AcrR family transcriptional regulator
MPTDTKERLIEAALRRFKRDSFRDVGVDQIFGDVGISRTAFYKHFASKEDLMVAALELQARLMQEAFRQIVRERGGRSALGQIRALFDAVESFVASDDFHGCVFIHASMEFPLPHDPAHQAAARNRDAIVDMIHDLAERAGATDPEGMAEEICLLMEGVYVSRQITGRRDVVDLARRLAEDVIRRHAGGEISGTGVFGAAAVQDGQPWRPSRTSGPAVS